MQGPKFTIGLNETLLGIVAPFWFKDTMLNTVGQRQTELALQLGTLFTADQALSIGLVDKVIHFSKDLEGTFALHVWFNSVKYAVMHTGLFAHLNRRMKGNLLTVCVFRSYRTERRV